MALVPRWEVSLRWRIVWNLGVALYTALVGVLIVLDNELKPQTAPALHEPGLIIPAVVILVLVTCIDAVRRAAVRARVVKDERKSVAIRNQLATALVTVAEELGISVSDLGCGLFLVKPRGVRRPERLVRVERVRIPDDLHESSVVFTKGKGAVGECWMHGRVTHNELFGINKKYADQAELIDHRWDTLAPHTKKGFEKSEFISVVGKYAEVLAVPIVHEGTFVGCVSLDRRWNRSDVSERCVLNKDATKKVLGGAARTLVPTLAP